MLYIKEEYENCFNPVLNVLNELIEGGIPGNDCIIYHNGELVFRSTLGYSDTEKKIPINGKERYNIYSCSKPITCTAAMQLAEQGKLSLSDPVYKFFPRFKDAMVTDGDTLVPLNKPITLLHLFTMTAGLDYDLESEPIKLAQKETGGKCKTVDMPDYIIRKPLLFQPGEHYNYSLCHDIIAAIVELVSGMRFGEYVKKNIFDPLGMTHSTYLLDDSELDTVSSQYTFDSETNSARLMDKHICYKLGSEYESGGAGCISTVEDYIKFLEAMRKGDIILKKETIDLMSTPQIADSTAAREFQEKCFDGYGYGLGMRCPLPGSDITDFGWDGAAGAHLVIDREYGYTLYYAQHVLNTSEYLWLLKRKLTSVSQACIKDFINKSHS